MPVSGSMGTVPPAPGAGREPAEDSEGRTQAVETRVGLSSAFPGRDCHVSVQDHLWSLSSGQEATAAEGGSQGEVCRFEPDDPLGNAG